jgi:nicotinate-nucleotide adenylyltransferase
MKIALFGGSFDPIHIGHINIIKEAKSSLDIDKVFVIPTYLNPFKSKVFASTEDRVKWINSSLNQISYVNIIDYEIKCAKPTPSIDTVKYIFSKYDIEKAYLIIGADNLASLSKWSKYNELKELVEFVVAKRSNISISSEYKILDIDVDIKSTEIRALQKLDYLPIIIKDEVYKFYQKRKLMEKRIENIVTILDSKKAENIETFDLKDSDYFVDYVVIATTLNNKHGISLLDYLKNDLKPLGESFLNIDEDDNWVVIDLGDILIHLMNEDYREKYNLEEFLAELTKERE